MWIPTDVTPIHALVFSRSDTGLHAHGQYCAVVDLKSFRRRFEVFMDFGTSSWSNAPKLPPLDQPDCQWYCLFARQMTVSGTVWKTDLGRLSVMPPGPLEQIGIQAASVDNDMMYFGAQWSRLT